MLNFVEDGSQKIVLQIMDYDASGAATWFVNHNYDLFDKQAEWWREELDNNGNIVDRLVELPLVDSDGCFNIEYKLTGISNAKDIDIQNCIVFDEPAGIQFPL